jgi:hypothetical protein
VSTIPQSGSVPRSPLPAHDDPLPVWATVGAAYRSVFSDGSRVVLRSAAWFGLLVLANLLAFFLAQGAGPGISDLIGLVVSIAAYVSLAVGWHRSVIVGETPRSAGEALRFGPREWRFLGISILAVLIVVGPLVIVMTLATAAGKADGIGFLLASSAAVGWALFVTARLSLAFPLIAVDGAPTPLRTSWHMTARSWLRILATIIAAGAPFIIVVELLGLLASNVSGPAGLIVLLVLLSVLLLLQVGVMASVASHAYLHLRGGAPPRPST